jgi:hypothetical protein
MVRFFLSIHMTDTGIVHYKTISSAFIVCASHYYGTWMGPTSPSGPNNNINLIAAKLKSVCQHHSRGRFKSLFSYDSDSTLAEF